MKPGLTEYIKFSDGIQVKFGGLFVASYLTREHTVSIDSFQPIHKDPFDRILFAQVAVEGITL